MGQLLNDNMSVLTEKNIELNEEWLNNFLIIYQQLNKNNLITLHNIYHDDITFIDPIHQVEGLTNLVDYFTHLYTNLLSCDFIINDVLHKNEIASIYWTMTYSHTKLNSGKPVSVQGSSLLKMADNKVIYHRDYLDVGAMLYEHIPLIGTLIKSIKKRASK